MVNSMKEIFKSGCTLFFKTIATNIMCLFLVMSFTMIFNGIFTENIGYHALGTTAENEQSVELYTHYYADGDDTKLAEYEAQGYTVSTIEIRSELSKGKSIGLDVITQIFCFLLLYTFIYPNLWHIGTKDSNLVNFKHKKEDLLKGLKIGLIASAPSIIFMLLLTLLPIKFATHFPVSIYKLCNSSLYSFISLATGGNTTMGALSLLQVVSLFFILLIPVAICTLAYLLGAKNISISEKFIYKKNKAGND